MKLYINDKLSNIDLTKLKSVGEGRQGKIYRLNHKEIIEIYDYAAKEC